MKGKKSELVKDFENFAQALWLEIPSAFVQRALGQADDSTVSDAGWKAYDAWIGIANEVTNRIYENDTIAEITGRAMEAALRIQQVGGTLTTAFFNNLWPTIGLPSKNEVETLRSEFAALQRTLQAATEQTEHAQVAHRAVDDGLKLVRGHGHTKRPIEDKENAAA
jgi:hypothetical protein